MEILVATLEGGTGPLQFNRGDAYPFDTSTLPDPPPPPPPPPPNLIAMIPQTFDAPLPVPTMVPILTGFDVEYIDAQNKTADHHLRNLFVDVRLAEHAWNETATPSTGTYNYGVVLRIRVGMRDNSPTGKPDDPFRATIYASVLCIVDTSSPLPVHP
jgi:hypothetical protein